MIKSAITHIGVQDNISLGTVDGLTSESHAILKIFKSVADCGIDVDMISMSLRHKNKMDLYYQNKYKIKESRYEKTQRKIEEWLKEDD